MNSPKKPSTLAQQVADAQAEYDTWSPERKATVRLEGSSSLDVPKGEANETT